ncbi:hypothetical protein STEG23_031066 [Scotinomys teguina]
METEAGGNTSRSIIQTAVIWISHNGILKAQSGVKQKEGPCFNIHSVNLCLFIVGKIFFNDFVEYVFCAFELVFFSFFYPYYSKNVAQNWVIKYEL